MSDIILDVPPCSKPRMTQSDRWKQRPAVLKYRAFADSLRLAVKKPKYVPGEILSITFVLPMPKSWSKKKRKEKNRKPHRQKPDLDNLLKAFQDALLKEDSHVNEYRNCRKIWGNEGQIIIHDPAPETIRREHITCPWCETEYPEIHIFYLRDESTQWGQERCENQSCLSPFYIQEIVYPEAKEPGVTIREYQTSRRK